MPLPVAEPHQFPPGTVCPVIRIEWLVLKMTWTCPVIALLRLQPQGLAWQTWCPTAEGDKDQENVIYPLPFKNWVGYKGQVNKTRISILLVQDFNAFPSTKHTQSLLL